VHPSLRNSDKLVQRDLDSLGNAPFVVQDTSYPSLEDIVKEL
jgi:hypothetical protein